MANSIDKYTVSFGLSLVITSILSALLVIAKEKNQALMSWMQGLTGHHWITQGILVLVLFLVLGLLLANLKSIEDMGSKTNNLAVTIVTGIIVGGLILAGFFLAEL
ncbi:MAG TPA: hypothetical protein VK138_04165 [Acidiferrobacterales bacterium]|nr:hypothetical protein [Acidiferrobacterales bacterium]